MSNNKQSMKLYTKEQVKKAIESARENSFGSDFQRWLTKSEESIMKGLTSIELPSDEELKKQFDIDEYGPYDLAYLGGAIRMRNLIQGGNK